MVKGSDRKGVVNVKFAAIDGDKLRLDVTSAIGSHVASMLVTQDKLQYLVVANKQMVESKPNKDAMAQILKIPMEPTVLYNVLFDRPIENKNWSCTNDEQNYLKQCKELRSKLTVDWKSREGHKRIIDIQHSSGSVQLNLTDFNSSVSNPDQAFSLSAPASFKVIKR